MYASGLSWASPSASSPGSAPSSFIALDYTGKFLIGYLGGYHMPEAKESGGGVGSAGFVRPWAIPLIAFGGAMLSATLVARFAPEAEGHGTDTAIEAVHTDPRSIRSRVVMVKMLASALTIGSGGSGGREGPTAQISAGFGSLLTACSTCRTPTAGWRSHWASDLASARSWSAAGRCGARRLDRLSRGLRLQGIGPGLVTSGTAYAIYGSIMGFAPMFGSVEPEYRFDPAQLGWFVLIGIVSAAIGYLYARVFYGTVDLTHRLPGGKVIKPALGGLMVGLLALLIPQVLSSG